MLSRIVLRSKLHRPAAVRFYSEAPGQGSSSACIHPAAQPEATVDTNVTGLSDACIHPAAQPVGPNVEPNKSGAYKVPEYFCYDSTTYFEAEVEMAKYRLPQPSALNRIES